MKNFKIALSVFVFSILFTGIAMSQGLGFKAGVNMASMKFDPDVFDVKSKIGIQVGAFYEVAAGESLVIRPGLSYSGKGAKADTDDGEDLSLNYLDIPVDVVYKLAVGENKLGIHAGPYVGMLLSASSGEDDIKEDLKGIDFGINIGAAYELQNIMIGVNYGLGLSDIADSPDLDGISIKNTNISLTIGYRL